MPGSLRATIIKTGWVWPQTIKGENNVDLVTGAVGYAKERKL